MEQDTEQRTATADIEARHRVEQRVVCTELCAASAVPHAIHAVLFFNAGLTLLAWLGVAAVVIHTTTAILAFRGRARLAMWITGVEVASHVPVLMVALGAEAGNGYYFVVAVFAAVLGFRHREHRFDLVSGTSMFVAAAIVGVTLPHFVEPFPVAPELAGALHDINAVLAVVVSVGGSAYFVRAQVASDREISRLRERIDQALQLGQYTLEEKIGEGGMGVVYKARHALLRRPTAIKLLPPDKVGSEAVKRFEREVQLTSQLTHPNTVAIYDYGHSPDGLFYYAMEYLDGVDLDTLVVDHGALPFGRVVSILMQVCEALDEAHEAGLIHRDVKPANILLCMQGKRPDVAKVLDFGLVKDLRADDSATDANIIKGTPAFLPPEAVTKPDALGPASDVYSLGASAYFLLTGQPVFPGDTIAKICHHHVYSEPQPLSELVSDIPAELDALIMACLAKDPEDRPPSAAAVRDRLVRIPVTDWDEARARSWWHQHRAQASASKRVPDVEVRTVTVNITERLAELAS